VTNNQGYKPRNMVENKVDNKKQQNLSNTFAQPHIIQEGITCFNKQFKSYSEPKIKGRKV
jgi:hypothetical protein